MRQARRLRPVEPMSDSAGHRELSILSLLKTWDDFDARIIFMYTMEKRPPAGRQMINERTRMQSMFVLQFILAGPKGGDHIRYGEGDLGIED